MELSDQLHAATALPPVRSEDAIGWACRAVTDVLGKRKFICPRRQSELRATQAEPRHEILL